jgi:hypothetical protein
MPSSPNLQACANTSGVKPRRLHPADHVGQLPPETVECLPDPIVIIVIETELLSATRALESPVAANPFKRSLALTTTVRAASELHNVARRNGNTGRDSEAVGRSGQPSSGGHENPARAGRASPGACWRSGRPRTSVLCRGTCFALRIGPRRCRRALPRRPRHWRSHCRRRPGHCQTSHC